jgi:hypothetical protein
MRVSSLLTIIPVVTAIPLPQYVLGTISPYPTLKNVMAISHMVFSKLACSASWYLEIRNQAQGGSSRRRNQSNRILSWIEEGSPAECVGVLLVSIERSMNLYSG